MALPQPPKMNTTTLGFWIERHLPWLAILWLLLISWLGFLWHLGSLGLVDETEPLFVEAARQMVVTNDWITPYFNEVTRFDKPPLVYWLIALGFKFIGVNEWMARLPSALSAIALVWFGFFVLWRYGVTRPGQTLDSPQGQRQRWLSAWLGAPLIAFNLHTLAWGRTGVSDMLLSGCMGSALFCFFMGYAEQQDPGDRPWPRPWYLGFYGLVALAVLTKGPVGIVLPGLIIFLFTLYTGELKAVWREMRPLAGGMLFLGIAVPWFVLVIIANGEAYINAFFGYHNVERFTSVVNGHAGPWYFYFVVLAAGLIPWFTYLPLAFTRLQFWQRRHWGKQPRSAQLSLFLFWWFVAVFGFFSIAVTRLPSYILPLMAPAGMLVGQLWAERALVPSDRPGWGWPVAVVANAIVMLLLGFFLGNLTHIITFDDAAQPFAQILPTTGLLTRALGIWGVAGLAILGLWLQRRFLAWVSVVNLIAFVLFFTLVLQPTSMLFDQIRQQPLRTIASEIRTKKPPETPIWMFGFKKPSLVFYTQQPVHYFSGTEEARQIWQEKGDPSPVWLVIESKTLEQLSWPQVGYESIDRQGIYDLIQLNPPLIWSNEEDKTQAHLMPTKSERSP